MEICLDMISPLREIVCTDNLQVGMGGFEGRVQGC